MNTEFEDFTHIDLNADDDNENNAVVDELYGESNEKTEKTSRQKDAAEDEGLRLKNAEHWQVKQLSAALHNGDLNSAQEILAGVAKNPQSVKRVMTAIKEQLEKANNTNAIRWEVGVDSNNETIVRLHITHTPETVGKVAAIQSRIMVGSDGAHSALTNFGRHMDPAEHLREVMVIPSSDTQTLEHIIPRLQLQWQQYSNEVIRINPEYNGCIKRPPDGGIWKEQKK